MASSRFKSLELDVGARALLVAYATDDGKTAKKRIRLKDMDADTDVPALADAILKSCDIIPAARQPLLVELLYELQLADTRSTERTRSGSAAEPSQPQQQQQQQQQAQQQQAPLQQQQAQRKEPQQQSCCSRSGLYGVFYACCACFWRCSAAYLVL